MKKLSLVLSSCALALSAAHANAELSANVAMSTDYVWRGFTQTLGDPATSGGFDYAHESGAYAGIWGSNVDFGTTANMEFDAYAGYAADVAEGVGIDVGVIRYMYPDEGALNWNEVYGSVSYMGATLGLAYSDDVYGGDVDGIYYSAGYEAALPMDVTLSASIGYYDIDASNANSFDWKVAVSREYQGIGVELAYFDVDSDTNSLDDDGLVFTLSKSM